MLKEDFDSKCEVIETLETAQNTLQARIKYKYVVIQGQNEVIVSLKRVM